MMNCGKIQGNNLQCVALLDFFSFFFSVGFLAFSFVFFFFFCLSMYNKNEQQESTEVHASSHCCTVPVPAYSSHMPALQYESVSTPPSVSWHGSPCELGTRSRDTSCATQHLQTQALRHHPHATPCSSSPMRRPSPEELPVRTSRRGGIGRGDGSGGHVCKQTNGRLLIREETQGEMG